MEALQQPTIRVVAVIAEGVPEADTKRLIAYARAHNKILLGPATVGGIQVCVAGPCAGQQAEQCGIGQQETGARPAWVHCCARSRAAPATVGCLAVAESR